MESRAALSLQQPAERAPTPSGEPPRRLSPSGAGAASGPSPPACCSTPPSPRRTCRGWPCRPSRCWSSSAAAPASGTARCSACCTGSRCSCRWWSGRQPTPASARCVALALLQAVLPRPARAALALVGHGAAAGRCGPRRCGCWRRRCGTGIPFGGFPWGRLAFSQGDSALTPLAALGGAPLLSFAVALLAGTLAWSVLAVRRLPSCSPRWPVAVARGRAACRCRPTATPSAWPSSRATCRGWGWTSTPSAPLCCANHVEATRRLAADVRAGRQRRPDLVMWPENASDLDPFTDAEAYAVIDAAVKDVGVPVLVGAVLARAGRRRSATPASCGTRCTGPGRRYVKRHPVPFGEYIPYRSLVRKVTSKVDLVPRDFAPGDDGRRAGRRAGAARRRHLLRGGLRRPGAGRGHRRGQADGRADQQRDLRAQRRDRAAAGDGPAARRRARPDGPGRRDQRHQRRDRAGRQDRGRRPRLHPRGPGRTRSPYAPAARRPPAPARGPRPRSPPCGLVGLGLAARRRAA